MDYNWQYYTSNQWPLAWKTGTSYGYKDAWAVGYNPEWTIVVWVGNFSGSGNPAIIGAKAAGPLLFKLFSSLPKNPDLQWFKRKDSDFKKVAIWPNTGYFSNEDSYKLEQYKKEFPSKDPAVAQSIFMNKDLKTVDDFDIVKWGLQLDNPGLKGGEEGIKQTVAEEFGIDPELEISEWSVSAQNRLVIKANTYRSEFEAMKQIEAPKRLDIDSIRQQRQQDVASSLETRKTAWADVTKGIESDLSTLKVPVGTPKEGEPQEYFDWDVGSANNETVSSIVEQMVASGSDVNDDTITFAKQSARLAMQDKSMPEIMAKYKASILANSEADHLKETHNPEPLLDTSRPEGEAEKEKKEFSDWAASTEGGFKRRPLI